MKPIHKTHAFAAACFGMMFFGITMVALGSVLPSLSLKLALTTMQKATLASTLTASILAGSVIFGPVCDTYGHRALFFGSCFAVVAGLAGIAFAPSMHWLLLSYVLIGIGGGVLNGQTNTITSDLFDDESTRSARLSLLGAFYGVGAIAITLLMGTLGDIIDYKYLLLSLVVLLGVGSVLCFKAQFPAPTHAQSFPLRDVFRLLRSPSLVVLSLVLLFESSIESVTNNLVTSYFAGMKGVVLLLTVMMVALTAARFFLTWLSKRLKPGTILYSFFAVLFAGFALLPIASNIAVAMLAMVLIGFGTAATYPIVLGQLGSRFKRLSGTAFGIAISIALAGSSFLNAFVGGVLLRYYPYVMMAAVLAMAVLYRIGARIVKSRQKNK